MDVEAFLADSVVVAEGKLYAQGAGWNMINVNELPAQHDRIGIGLIITVPYTETNQEHAFSLHLETEDGERLSLGDAPPGMDTPDGRMRRIEGVFNMGRPPTLVAGDEQAIPLAINLNGLPFEAAGRYTFVVEVDGQEVKRLPFRVQPMRFGQPG
jgi:Family of unknown function (DUF6941)